MVGECEIYEEEQGVLEMRKTDECGMEKFGTTRICEGISPLGYWQKVNQSPTQTKPYNTLPPFEQQDS